MTRQRYDWKESWNRILRKLQGKTLSSDIPGTVDGRVLSVDKVLSDLAEMLNDSLPGEALSIPFGNTVSAPTGSTPTLGGVLYAQNGALMWIGSSGTISTLAGS